MAQKVIRLHKKLTSSEAELIVCNYTVTILGSIKRAKINEAKQEILELIAPHASELPGATDIFVGTRHVNSKREARVDREPVTPEVRKEAKRISNKKAGKASNESLDRIHNLPTLTYDEVKQRYYNHITNLTNEQRAVIAHRFGFGVDKHSSKWVMDKFKITTYTYQLTLREGLAKLNVCTYKGKVFKELPRES